MVIVKNEHNIDDILLHPTEYIISGVEQPLVEIHTPTSPNAILLAAGALPIDREYPVENPFYISESQGDERKYYYCEEKDLLAQFNKIMSCICKEENA